MYPTNMSNLMSISNFQENVDKNVFNQDIQNIDLHRQNFEIDNRFLNPSFESSEAISNFEPHENLHFSESADRISGGESHDRLSPISDDSSQSFGVDLSGKSTSLAGKSFTIAAILGLRSSNAEVMNLTVGSNSLQHCWSQKLHQYSRSSLATDNERHLSNDATLAQSHIKGRALLCNGSSGRNKRIRTIFTPEQLERLEAEFERQQYMVGPERLYLAHALHLTEAQVKVWFQNRRIKWRKHHLEVTQQRLAVLQRHREDEDI